MVKELKYSTVGGTTEKHALLIRTLGDFTTNGSVCWLLTTLRGYYFLTYACSVVGKGD